MKRSWLEARAKVNEEGCCRSCGSHWRLEAAHIIARSRVTVGGEDRRNIVPLCQACHMLQHQGKLEILGLLTLDEQGYAAGLVGITEALRRTTVRVIAA